MGPLIRRLPSGSKIAFQQQAILPKSQEVRSFPIPPAVLTSRVSGIQFLRTPPLERNPGRGLWGHKPDTPASDSW